MNQYLRVRDFARNMRKNPTEAEEALWNQIRHRKLSGLKFNRQHVLAIYFDPTHTKFYIADFYCAELKLIIELDGEIHDQLLEEDIIRTEHLNQRGYQVLRFRNEEVIYNWANVREAILRARDSHPNPSL